ncbi:MAG: hypothetical protein ACR2QE_08350 [Acidimicrobiales bacterium]
MTTHHLVDIAPNVAVWLADRPRHGHPNSGIVLDEDGAFTVIDGQPAPSAATALLAAIEPGRVRRVVVTSSHVEFSGGTSVFTMAGVYGSATASLNLDLPPNRDGYSRLLPEFAPEYAELTTRSVSHAVTDPAWLGRSAVAVPSQGHQDDNLVVQVPGTDVVFAGAMATFGVTPIAFDGDPAAWADALDAVIDLGRIIVPGHGPVGTTDDVIALQAYLWACIEADGDPAAIPPGPWDDWDGREWDAVNVERAAMLAAGDPSPPPSMLRALGLA